MNTLKDYVNWGITHCDKVGSAEGVPLVMEKCKLNKKMKQLEVYGNSVQNGTPTPETPVEVESVGEKCTNNLFDKDNAKNLFSNGHLSEPTATGIAIIPISSTGYGFFDLGSASNYMGKTINATMKVPRLGSETYTAFFAVCSANGNNRAEKGTHNIIVENGFAYITATYTVEDVGDKHLSLHLRVDGAKKNNHYDFTEIMVTEGEETLPYEPYGKYKVPVLVKGKNIVNIDKMVNSALVANGDGSYTLTKNGGNRLSHSVKINVPIGTKYSLAIDIIDSSTNISLVLNSTTEGKGQYYNLSKLTGMVYTSLYMNDRIQIYIDSSAPDGSYVTFKNLMFNIIPENAEYEPYTEPITTNVYLNEPLRKIGDYADYIDFKGKKVVRRIYERIFNSANYPITNWSYSSAMNMFRLTVNLSDAYATLDLSQCALCNYYPIVQQSNRADDTVSGQVANRNIFDFIDTDFSSKEQWVTYLDELYNAGTPIKVIHALKTSYEEPINCDLPILTAKTTVIDIDTSVLPSNIKGKYIKR